MLMSFEYSNAKTSETQTSIVQPKPLPFASFNPRLRDSEHFEGSESAPSAIGKGLNFNHKERNRFFSGFLSRPNSARISSPFPLGINSEIWGIDNQTKRESNVISTSFVNSGTSKFSPFENSNHLNKGIGHGIKSNNNQIGKHNLNGHGKLSLRSSHPRSSGMLSKNHNDDYLGVDINYLEDKSSRSSPSPSITPLKFSSNSCSSVSLPSTKYTSNFKPYYEESYQPYSYDPWEDKRRMQHSNASLNQAPMASFINVPRPSSDPLPPRRKANINSELYKTEMCLSFQKTGSCSYSEKCQFAHGERELKNIDRPPKWRSKLCQNWLRSGSCAYNDRCCFKHV